VFFVVLGTSSQFDSLLNLALSNAVFFILANVPFPPNSSDTGPGARSSLVLFFSPDFLGMRGALFVLSFVSTHSHGPLGDAILFFLQGSLVPIPLLPDTALSPHPSILTDPPPAFFIKFFPVSPGRSPVGL